ncbi:hypothetical protein OBBRIDRAFT_835632 [Obba rivulosa]|uniref:Helitron helicase-like domain-containing protein n=1 Tax=Obba rivulosa TaxID=1052685 RepID=A0A8E2AWQ8_9APHY|nr:hypothetical protein OBBRIDRAFT_835632 [Obba rivulosa]
MFHDRRFQTDEYFAFIVFNHEQIKSATRAGYLVADRLQFSDISAKVLDLDERALTAIVERGKDGAFVTPETEEEKKCFQIITLIDYVAGHVDGSTTARKYQRNEIHGLMHRFNLPFFFVTFSPVDFKHPLCLYYCGEVIDIRDANPGLLAYDDRLRAIAANPVACARFFHAMVDLFIKHYLGCTGERDGVLGKTEAYYGTVEQQGRLTLHLHLLIWLSNALPPQEIRDRLLAGDEHFAQAIIAWLEDCHQGEFTSGSMDDIRAKVMVLRHGSTFDALIDDNLDASLDDSNTTWQDPSLTLPDIPPQTSDEDMIPNIHVGAAKARTATVEPVILEKHALRVLWSVRRALFG